MYQIINRNSYKISFRVIYKHSPDQHKHLIKNYDGDTGPQAVARLKKHIMNNWLNVQEVIILQWFNVQQPGSDYYKLEKDGTIKTSEK